MSESPEDAAAEPGGDLCHRPLESFLLDTPPEARGVRVVPLGQHDESDDARWGAAHWASVATVRPGGLHNNTSIIATLQGLGTKASRVLKVAAPVPSRRGPPPDHGGGGAPRSAQRSSPGLALAVAAALSGAGAAPGQAQTVSVAGAVGGEWVRNTLILQGVHEETAGPWFGGMAEIRLGPVVLGGRGMTGTLKPQGSGFAFERDASEWQAVARLEPVRWLGIERSHTVRAYSSPAGYQRWDISALGWCCPPRWDIRLSGLTPGGRCSRRCTWGATPAGPFYRAAVRVPASAWPAR